MPGMKFTGATSVSKLQHPPNTKKEKRLKFSEKFLPRFTLHAPSMTLFDNETLDLVISLAGSEEGGEERVGGREVTRRLGGGDQGRDLAVSSLVSQPRGTGDNLSHPSALGPQKRLSLRF